MQQLPKSKCVYMFTGYEESCLEAEEASAETEVASTEQAKQRHISVMMQPIFSVARCGQNPMATWYNVLPVVRIQ